MATPPRGVAPARRRPHARRGARARANATPRPRRATGVSVYKGKASENAREREQRDARSLVALRVLPSPPPPHLLGYILVVLNTYNATIPWARPLPARGAARCGAECGDFVSVSRNRAVFFSFFCGVGAGRGSRPRLGARGWVGLGFWLWTTREK